jgi:hypothetical protein
MPTLPQSVVDFGAGWGDAVSLGLTSWYRDAAGTNAVVNSDSGAYYVGMGVGVVNSSIALPAAGLNGGARSVFWSGEGSLSTARKIGVTIDKTPIGSVLNRFSSHVPESVWSGASSIFAMNASGTAIKVGQPIGSIWKTEQWILNMRNIPIIGVP